MKTFEISLGGSKWLVQGRSEKSVRRRFGPIVAGTLKIKEVKK